MHPDRSLPTLEARARRLRALVARRPPPKGASGALRPAEEAALAAFEARHDLALPPEYRMALRIVGDGGWRAGSAWHLPPLARAHRLRPISGSYDAKIGGYTRWMEADLTRDFPFTETWGPGAPEKDWELGDRGVLYLGTAGCTMQYLLVVRGPAYGQVWYDDLGADGPLMPVAPEFLDWCGV
ncbi:MAG: SMI1/KNR4 family protein [Pseudomonadota bacterium]